MDVCQSSRPLNSQQQAGTTAESTASNQAELNRRTRPKQKDLAENVWRSECSEMMRLPFSRTTTQARRYHAPLQAMHRNVPSGLYQHEFRSCWCSSVPTFSRESWPFLKLEQLPSQIRLLRDGGLATSVLYCLVWGYFELLPPLQTSTRAGPPAQRRT